MEEITNGYTKEDIKRILGSSWPTMPDILCSSADRVKGSIQFFDLNLGFIKELGGSLGTRMSGAHEAIQAIVSDPALKAGVNYGFGWWCQTSFTKHVDD